jgi:endoglucanase
MTVWLAVDCDPANRARAAAHRPLLQEQPAASARTLTGEVLDPTAHPLGLVAAAAAADADGDPAARDALLDEAAAQDQRSPTYYGAAWVALGRALLQDDVLDPCEDEA